MLFPLSDIIVEDIWYKPVLGAVNIPVLGSYPPASCAEDVHLKLLLFSHNLHHIIKHG
jgi:hypothetical protein